MKKAGPDNLPAKPSDGHVDLISDSFDYPLVVVFSKSTSPNYRAVVELAGLASKYAEKTIDKTTLHVAAFAADRVQMARALSLLRFIKGLRSTQVFSGGKLLPTSSKIEDVIDCFLTASACNDWRAHCYRIIRSPFADDAERTKWIEADLDIPWLEPSKPRKFNQYRFPCKFMTRYGEIHFRLEENHPVSATDQIQAMAVAHGCAWCPNFKPEDFKKL